MPWHEEDYLRLSHFGFLESSFKTVANINATFEDYIDVDCDVITTDNPSDDDILDQESLGAPPISDEYEEESVDIVKPLPTYGQLSSSVAGFRTYLEMKTNIPITVYTALNVLENYIEEEKWKNSFISISTGPLKMTPVPMTVAMKFK
ncbi:unnamed protein product [Ceratitis capitata]|uniref:(Mediterranean fruit fly) hypothetical protein n=1 Tax=Ceratitis capitata TaxID=7213 RepID=A0A811UCH4_CERCA|nr:unnamed protein product [Ceratitis capitata]